MTSGAQNHPNRRKKIDDWVKKSNGTFSVQQVAKDLNLPHSEVGNSLRTGEGVKPLGNGVWERV
jgi:hypothetical protein